MRRYLAIYLAACVALMGALPSGAAVTSSRLRFRMDADWRFKMVEGTAASVSGMPVIGWRWKAVDAAATDPQKMADPALDTSGADWHDAAIGQDLFGNRPGFAWVRAVLPKADKSGRVLHFQSVDDNGTVYLNGKKLVAHNGWDEPFDVPVDAAWKADGPNVLAVLVENEQGVGGLGGPVTLETASAVSAGDPISVGFNDRDWRVLHLPHDFVVEGAFTQGANVSHGSLPTGAGWYRKTFTLPAAYRGKSVWIDFDGVYRNSKVYLNGQLVGAHPCGYTSFRCDIGKAANYGGKNVLAVLADARRSEGWWYEGGGIYRHVWLNVADPLHVAPLGTFVTSDVPGEDKAHPATADIAIKTTLVNEGAAAGPCTLTSEVVEPDGKVVGHAESPADVSSGGSQDVEQKVTVSSPRLWSLETPQLYTLVTRVTRNGRAVDQVTTPFGIRTIRFDADRGFFLNGQPVKLKGTCNHQDFAGVGIGMPDSLLTWRIKKLKSMGSNAYRCSHNPVASELLDACDRLGMLVMDENRHLGDTENGKAGRDTPYQNLSEVEWMVQRDRNHPSIIMWSMCNEEPLQGSQEGATIFKAMMDAVHKYDTTRPISSAMNGAWGRGFSNVEDLQGCNYNPGGYDGYHRLHPNQPVFGSETASTVSTRGIYANDREKGYVSAYDVNRPGWGQTAEDGWQPLAERPYMLGGFVWTGFDYKGEPTPYGWPCINSHFGIMDECGFPKDNFYYYQAWWGDKPVVHILPHWNWAGKEGQPIDVWAHSNAAKVELFLNGRSLGVQEMPRYRHVQWSVPYAPGKLEAKGYDADGKVIATDTVETAGEPAGLKLTTDSTSLTADGEEVAMIEVAVVDAQGRVVPTADNEVTFTLTGPGQIAGIGNGDPSSHEPDRASKRHAFNGLCMAVIQASEKPGTLTLTASAQGLKPAEITLTSTRVPAGATPELK